MKFEIDTNPYKITISELTNAEFKALLLSMANGTEEKDIPDAPKPTIYRNHHSGKRKVAYNRPNQFKVWTDNDVSKLLDLREKGYSPNRIGMELGRTAQSVYSKLWEIKNKQAKHKWR